MKVGQRMAPLIEGNAGLSLLTIPEGLTLRKLVEIAKDKRFHVSVNWEEFIEKNDIPVEKTYRLIATNNMLKRSRDKVYKDQKELVGSERCEVMTLQEHFALHIFARIASKPLYGIDSDLAQRRFSTCIGSYPMVFGYNPSCHQLYAYSLCTVDADEERGIRGRRLLIPQDASVESRAHPEWNALL
jgi:hypothetical protein